MSGTRSGKHRRVPEDPPVKQTPAWMQKLDRDLYAILAIAAVWLIAILLVNPSGNFPLNDDWCYGRVVFDLLRTGRYQMVNTVAMPLLGQVLWAVPFCLVLGPTFLALRISTLVLAFGGLLALYGLLREARMPRWLACFGALVLALNPLYLLLSHGFMTDVPSMAFMLIAMYFYARALRTGSFRMILVGTVPAVAAVLTRQIGLFVPIGFALAYVVAYGMRGKNLLKAFLPAVVSAGAYLGYVHWLTATHRLPKLYNMQSDTVHKFLAGGPSIWMQAITQINFSAFMYTGLLILPFLILTIRRRKYILTQRQRIVNLVISLAVGAEVMIRLVADGRWMPVDAPPGQYIWNFGMAPLTLPDTWDLSLPRHATMPEGFWIVVTVATVIGAVLVLWHLLAAIEMLFSRDREAVPASDKAILVMLLSVAALNLVLLVPISTFRYFDRYFMLVMAIMTVVAARAVGPSVKVGRAGVAIACLILLLFGWFGIGATHDYFAWNRLRWQAGHELMKELGCGPQGINAGNEFSAWYCWNDAKVWWDPPSEDYIVTFGPLPDYEVMKKYTYKRWMPPGEGAVYVLERLYR